MARECILAVIGGINSLKGPTQVISADITKLKDGFKQMNHVYRYITVQQQQKTGDQITLFIYITSYVYEPISYGLSWPKRLVQ